MSLVAAKRYIVTRIALGNATLGQLKTRLSNTPTGYRVISETKAEGMAAVLLGSSLSEECHFDVIENQAVSRQYQGGSDKKTNYQVGFDWQQRKINFVKGETLDIPKGYVVDNCNLPFAIAATKGESLGEKPLYIIDGKKQRIRGFTLQSQNTEIVDTAIGKISTTKIVMQRELRPDKTLTLWLASDYQFLPIKMQEKRSSRTTTMLLNSWQLLGN